MSMVIDEPEVSIYQNQFPVNGEKLYLNTKSADVHFLFGEADDPVARIPAHKSLLSVESDVFETMFYGEMKEDGDVEMHDATDGEFMEFLKFFYLKEVKLSTSKIVGVLHLGHKYNVKKCVDHCVQHLMKTIDNENICRRLRLGILYEQSELIKACKRFITLHTAEVFASVGFSNCHKDVLDHILKMNVMSCSEVDVFHACMHWVKTKNGSCGDTISKESVEKYLGNLFYAIRFASMTMEQLFTLQSQYEAVLTPDFVTISKIIILPGFQADNFNTSPRQAKWNEDEIIKCSFKHGEQQVYLKASKVIFLMFSTSQPLLFGGFTCGEVCGFETGLKCILKSAVSTDVNISEICGINDKNLLNTKPNFHSTENHVAFPQPIFVRPGRFYKISISPFEDNLYISSRTLKKEIRLQSDIVIQFHTSSNTGSIWALDFNEI